MGNKRLQNGLLHVDIIRKVLRLWEQGYSQRAIHRATGAARSSIQEYLRLIGSSGITYEEAHELSDGALRERLGKQPPGRSRMTVTEPSWELVQKELGSRKGVTLELLWSEWCAQSGGGGMSYGTFCRRYREHERRVSVVMRQEYRPGEKCLTDYAGETLSYRDEEGTEHKAEIFVAVLGASDRIYAEASEAQKLEHWIGSHVRAFAFFGGVTESLIIDNFKSGVKHAHRYEPEINRTFEEFAEHYNTAVFPARARKPRDKAKVEQAVQMVERHVLAPLRKERFTSLAQINEAMRPLMDGLGKRIMKDYGISRDDLFEKLERDSLRPLPAQPFTVATWKRVRVSLDYHVQFDFHWYSVPYYHARKEVWVKVTEKLVEVFLGNERISSHARSFVKYRFSTQECHMPQQHLAMRSMTAENFTSWAKTVGASTQEVVAHILGLPRYKEQAYRSLLGLQRLEKRYGTVEFETACALAVKRRTFSQRAVHQILESTAAPKGAFSHENIRGGQYYH